MRAALEARAGLAVALAVVCVCASSVAIASDHADSGEAPEAQVQVHHRHHVGAFFGGASAAEEHRNDQHGFVGGFEYEYRFMQRVGVGVFAEGAAGNLRGGAFAGSLFLHPWRGTQLSVGPGVEVSSHGTKYMTRFGFAYQIPIGERFTVAPDFSIDLLKHHPIYVYGVTLGVGF